MRECMKEWRVRRECIVSQSVSRVKISRVSSECNITYSVLAVSVT